MQAIPANLPSLITSAILAVGGIAVGFGAFDQGSLQIVAASTGVVAGGILQIVSVFEKRTVAIEKQTAALALQATALSQIAANVGTTIAKRG